MLPYEAIFGINRREGTLGPECANGAEQASKIARILRGMTAAPCAGMSKHLLAHGLLISALLAAGIPSASNALMLSLVSPDVAIPSNGGSRHRRSPQGAMR
jgi:hypothetical protein